MKSTKSRYRVDTVPWLILPLFWAYGYALGIGAYLYVRFVNRTSKIIVVRSQVANESQNSIICIWHQDMWVYFAALGKHYNHAWMNHPVWYMKPVHVFMRMFGIEKIVLGSSGNEGRKAAEELAGYLSQGFSTVMTVDGPYGPVKIPKKGAIHLAIQTGLPIQPIRYSCKRAIVLRGWDRKIIPLPFNTITATHMDPIFPERENIESALDDLKKSLG